jgi:hypothetical protein
MVTGAVPFEGTSPYAIMNARLVGDPVAPRRINPDIPPQVEEIILHAMAEKPYDRYPSAAAMKAELDAPETVQLTGRHERLREQRPWKSRWRWIRYVLWAVVVPLVVLGLLFLIGSRHR